MDEAPPERADATTAGPRSASPTAEGADPSIEPPTLPSGGIACLALVVFAIGTLLLVATTTALVVWALHLGGFW